jgi:hypothetical protein
VSGAYINFYDRGAPPILNSIGPCHIGGIRGSEPGRAEGEIGGMAGPVAETIRARQCVFGAELPTPGTGIAPNVTARSGTDLPSGSAATDRSGIQSVWNRGAGDSSYASSDPQASVSSNESDGL